MSKSILAWHFAPDDGRLGYNDGREIQVGETLAVAGPLVLCEHGLHASVRLIDALDYAAGALVCRVRLSGEILAPAGEDKCCGSERTVLAKAEASALLHEFACWCAEEALQREREAGREPDARSGAAIEAKRRWVKGEIDSSELDAARAAASAAGWDAGWGAARAAGWDAARAAARAAASAAAWAAARDAGWDAAWAAQNEELERRVRALLGPIPGEEPA